MTKRVSRKSPASLKGTGARTNLVLDARLVARVKQLSGMKSTREAVHVALDHYVRSSGYYRVLALYGSGGVAEKYDPKATQQT